MFSPVAFLCMSSPNPTIERTFQAVFASPQEHGRTQNTPPKCYRNPVILAREWQKRLQHEHDTPAEVARKLRVSRARATQILRLLRLAPDVLQQLAALRGPLPTPVITERILRPIVNLAPDDQRAWLAIFRQKRLRRFTCQGENRFAGAHAETEP
jgi:hypothetical protein